MSLKTKLFCFTIFLYSFLLSADELSTFQIDITAPKSFGYYKPDTFTATKTNTQLIDIPQTVNVINQKQLQDQQATDLGKAITYVPGITLDQGEGNRDAFVIRGNKTTADIFSDGIKDDAEYYRDLYNIEQVDILMGANAILFGKGGSGGIVNRVTKKAQFKDFNQLTVQAGSLDSERGVLDINRQLTDRLAIRLNTMAERSDSFISGVNYEKQGINPVFTYLLGNDTTITFGREYFHDQRIGYRGVPSKNGRPYDSNRDQYFGVASLSPNEVSVNSTFFTIDHDFSANLNLKNSTRYTDYDKFYQNVYASDAVLASDTLKLKAYFNDTQRQNFFNQTDLTWKFKTGSMQHTFLSGLEFGNQDNRSYRFEYDVSGSKTQTVNVSSPYGANWVFNTFTRDRRTDIQSKSIYLQDQIKFNDQHQFVLGIRKDDYETKFNDIKTSLKTTIDDQMTSSRLGYIYSPFKNQSYYVSYSNAYQPRNGDQLESITASNVNEDPEKFINYEIGTKWDITSKLSATLSIYQLDRERMQIIDPADNSRNIIVDGQKTRGIETSVNGQLTDKWLVVGGYSYI
ncbi:MAG: TonB-dependent siderophore receptor, partial [Nitrosomonadales bacterium]